MMFKRILFALSLISIVSCSARAPDTELSKYREAKLMMGTIVQIDVCHEEEDEPGVKKAIEKVWQRIETIEKRMSSYKEQSDISLLNRSQPKTRQVHSDTYQVIRKAVEYSRLTEGSFDITVGPLIKLWEKAEEQNQIPSKKEIKRLLENVGSEMIRLDEGNGIALVGISVPNAVEIDLGGIAKGFAIDEAARTLRESGIRQFFIDAGGDVYVGGKNCENQPWRIGIRNPLETSKLIDIIRSENAAVTTSGDYERFFLIQGQKWSHVINPVTGYPQKDVVSATVVAPNATMADALSTAFCVLSPDRGISLIEKLGKGFAAKVIVLERGGSLKIHESKNFLNLHYTN